MKYLSYFLFLVLVLATHAFAGVAYFNEPGVYPFAVPENVTRIHIDAAGGGGGGGASCVFGEYGGPGGDGGYFSRWVHVSPGEMLFVDVGPGGPGSCGVYGGDGGGGGGAAVYGPEGDTLVWAGGGGGGSGNGSLCLLCGGPGGDGTVRINW